MSKVTLELTLDQTLCSELEDIRTMLKTLDFSGLSATVERIQVHGNAMENALYAYKDTFTLMEKVFDEEKREKWDGSSDFPKTLKGKYEKLKELLDNRKVRVKY